MMCAVLAVDRLPATSEQHAACSLTSTLTIHKREVLKLQQIIFLERKTLKTVTMSSHIVTATLAHPVVWPRRYPQLKYLSVTISKLCRPLTVSTHQRVDNPQGLQQHNEFKHFQQESNRDESVTRERLFEDPMCCRAASGVALVYSTLSKSPTSGCCTGSSFHGLHCTQHKTTSNEISPSCVGRSIRCTYEGEGKEGLDWCLGKKVQQISIAHWLLAATVEGDDWVCILLCVSHRPRVLQEVSNIAWTNGKGDAKEFPPNTAIFFTLLIYFKAANRSAAGKISRSNPPMKTVHFEGETTAIGTHSKDAETLHAAQRFRDRPASLGIFHNHLPAGLDSSVLCTLEPQLCVHWLLPHTWQLWDLQGVSLQVCHWLRSAQGSFIKLRSNSELRLVGGDNKRLKFTLPTNKLAKYPGLQYGTQYVFRFEFSIGPRITRLPPRLTRLDSRRGCSPDFRTWGLCRTIPLFGGFSRGSPVSPRPLHSDAAPYSTRFTPVGSQDLDVKGCPNPSARSTVLFFASSLSYSFLLQGNKRCGSSADVMCCSGHTSWHNGD
ncbi:hypothetical protein PR048_031177 [Dryococelus australis]|uniref:Uncharacterized protein n=1 Tax=Dryococelus australis TaxID=614101 RepID=A0ABQ9G8M1_9NEOP|nr:hypothetical protein PR048_031177 [Dryococelus australis]